MRAKFEITYNLDKPEEESRIRLMMKAEELKSVLWDYDQWLRGLVKHGDLPEEKENIYQECRDKLWELLKEIEFDLYSI